MEDLIKELGQRVEKRELQWKDALIEFNKKTGENITSEALRKRYYRIKKESPSKMSNGDYETYYSDGTIEAQKVVNLPREIKNNPSKVLEYLGYNPNEWEIVSMSFSTWNQHTKEQTTKNLYAVKYRLKPKVNELSEKEVLEIATRVFSQKLEPRKFEPRYYNNELSKEDVLLLPAVELHLGKEASPFDVGEYYGVDLAIERYDAIVEVVKLEQEAKKASKLVYGVGNDFFNVDTPSNTTTRGTQQLGGTSAYELFDIGLRLQIQSLIDLRESFNEIEVILVQGNHANMLEYTLYRALEQYFKEDDIVKFRSNYKEVQALEMGSTSVFMTHGDMNYKRTIEQMSREFNEIYGRTENRYILLGHLHHKQRVEELNGFTVFRLSSPSGVDRWHYKERYLSSAGQEIFLFNKEEGLTNIRFINFPKVLEKRK